jgi:Polymer-forming cytoskeletal
MRLLLAVAISAVVVLGAGPSASAQTTSTSKALVVLTGSADVAKGEQVGDLVLFHGSSTVDGVVNGSLTAFDANVTISGRVNGDVQVFKGHVKLLPGAHVTGDVVSQSAPSVASGATIGGSTRKVQSRFVTKGFGWVGRFAWWLAVSVSTLIVGLVLLWLTGRGSGRILSAGSDSVGASIGWGLLAFFGLPILGVIALVTIVGIPLGLGLLAALILIYAIGYTCSAWILGRRIVHEPTGWIVAFLAGWAILRVAAFIPILGGLVWFIAVVFGLGALLVAIWRTRSDSAAA